MFSRLDFSSRAEDRLERRELEDRRGGRREKRVDRGDRREGRGVESPRKVSNVVLKSPLLHRNNLV